MSVNTSSASFDSELLHCFNSTVSIFIGAAFHATKAIILLPLSIFVFYLGFQQWRQQRSFATASHSDVFTYHLAAMEWIWLVGLAFFYGGSDADLRVVTIAGYCLSSITFSGENFFHLLTCVERYLAVVHPIIYMKLRNARGVRIRNVIVGSVWLLCFGWSGVIGLYYPSVPIIPTLCSSVFSLVVVSFCSLSVLCVLIRPGPGEGGREKERVDQSKQRAFFTIVVIMGALCLWFVGILVLTIQEDSLQSHSVLCSMKTSLYWTNLPSSLVLPLLYLHRAGKLPCCCCNGGCRQALD